MPVYYWVRVCSVEAQGKNRQCITTKDIVEIRIIIFSPADADYNMYI